jgi:hypothetical protein
MTVEAIGYCYHLVSVTSFSLSQRDHIKQLPFVFKQRSRGNRDTIVIQIEGKEGQNIQKINTIFVALGGLY